MAKKKRQSFLDFWREKRPDFFQKGGVLHSSRAVFSLEELRQCFEESRLTHPMVGFKHETFEQYLEWFDKQKEGQAEPK